MAATALLEIHVHLVNGSISRFVQDEPVEIDRILNHIHPEKVFNQPTIVIAGRHSMTALPTSAVARIDFVMDGFPGWEFHRNLKDAVQITHEELRERYIPIAETSTRTDMAVPEGEVVTAFAEAELMGGERLYVEVQLTADRRTPLERGMLLHQIFTGSSLYARRRGGGGILINPANVVRITLYPGPPETPPNAWPARHLTGL